MESKHPAQLWLSVRRNARQLLLVLVFFLLWWFFVRSQRNIDGVNLNHGSCTRHIAPPICVLVRYTPSQIRRLPGLLASLHGSYYEGPVHITIVAIDVDHEAAEVGRRQGEDVFRKVSAIFNDPCVTGGVSSRTSKDPEVEMLRFNLHLDPDVNDYGYLLTDVVKDDLLWRSDINECGYLLFTNGDNLYLSDIFPAVTPYLTNGTDIVGVHMVSHTKNAALGAEGGSARASNVLLRTVFHESAIGLGAVFVSASTLRRHRIRFSDESQFWAADGFISRLAKVDVSRHVVPQILFVHQRGNDDNFDTS